MNEPIFLIIDLFCGAGGTTTGFENASISGNKIAKVIACVNHNPNAIKSHLMNHPDVKHFEEDILTMDLTQLELVVNYNRNKYPNALVILWGSLPCPHFSKALGDKPKNEGMRTMAKSLYMKWDRVKEKHFEGDSYIQVLKPDYVMIENVEEFQTWGPLDQNKRPISKTKGQDFEEFRHRIRRLGFNDEWKQMNSADFGAFTSRNRLFGCFAKSGLPIVWPQPSHSRNQTKDLFNQLQKWKSCRPKIDINDTGTSILHRKKPLADKTIAGIIKGIKKFALKGTSYFLFHYYGNSFCTSPDDPCPAFRTKQSAYLIQTFIHNPSHGGHCTSTEQPCPVIVARQDKAPLRLTTCMKGQTDIVINENDSNVYRELKQLMIDNGIAYIFYRPLRTREKLIIQGFPEKYSLFGTQADQEMQIGNSVVPEVVEAWCIALAVEILNKIKKVA